MPGELIIGEQSKCLEESVSGRSSHFSRQQSVKPAPIPGPTIYLRRDSMNSTEKLRERHITALPITGSGLAWWDPERKWRVLSMCSGSGDSVDYCFGTGFRLSASQFCLFSNRTRRPRDPKLPLLWQMIQCRHRFLSVSVGPVHFPKSAQDISSTLTGEMEHRTTNLHRPLFSAKLCLNDFPTESHVGGANPSRRDVARHVGETREGRNSKSPPQSGGTFGTCSPLCAQDPPQSRRGYSGSRCFLPEALAIRE